MIKYTQSKVVVRNSENKIIQHGNCYQTAIASLLEIPPTEVPNIETLFDIGAGYAYAVMHKWLNNIGMNYNSGAWQFSIFHENNPKIKDAEHIQEYLRDLSEDAKLTIRSQYKDKYYLVSGLSSRGVHHICIYQNGILAHDPHPTQEGIITEEYFECLEPINKTDI